MDNKGNNTNSTPTPAATVPEPRVQPAPTQPVPQGPAKKKGMSKGMLWGIIHRWFDRLHLVGRWYCSCSDFIERSK